MSNKHQLAASFISGPHGSTMIKLKRAETYVLPDGPTFIVPAGFVSDGCSLPRFFWRVIGHPFSLDYLREAVLHDYLYKTQIVTRARADKILFDLLDKPRTRARRYLIYVGLRLGGWWAWFQHTRALRRQGAKKGCGL